MELITVFVSLIDDWELLLILEEHGLISQTDIESFGHALDCRPPFVADLHRNDKEFERYLERHLRPLVQRAYKQWNYKQ